MKHIPLLKEFISAELSRKNTDNKKEQKQKALLTYLSKFEFAKDFDVDFSFLKNVDNSTPEQIKQVNTELREKFVAALFSNTFDSEGNLDELILGKNLNHWLDYFFQKQDDYNKNRSLITTIKEYTKKDKAVPSNHWLTDADLEEVISKYAKECEKRSIKIANPRSISENAQPLKDALQENKDFNTVIVPLNYDNNHWVLFIREGSTFTYWDPIKKADVQNETVLNNIQSALNETYPTNTPIYTLKFGEQPNSRSCGDLCLREAFKIAKVKMPLSDIDGYEPSAMDALREAVIDIVASVKYDLKNQNVLIMNKLINLYTNAVIGVAQQAAEKMLDKIIQNLIENKKFEDSKAVQFLNKLIIKIEQDPRFAEKSKAEPNTLTAYLTDVLKALEENQYNNTGSDSELDALVKEITGKLDPITSQATLSNLGLFAAPKADRMKSCREQSNINQEQTSSTAFVC